MRSALLPILILTALGTTGFRSEDTYSLISKPQLGETRAFVIRSESKFVDMKIVATGAISQRVTEVGEDGSYSVEISTGELRIAINDEAVPEDPDAPTTRTQRFDPSGNFIYEEGIDESSADIAYRFAPKNPVKIGETWRPEGGEGKLQPLEWTLIGKEELGGKTAFVLEGKGKGFKQETISSKVWIDPLTFRTRKATTTILNIQNETLGIGEQVTVQEEKP